MSLKRPTDEVLQLVRNGASVHVSGGDYPSDDILQLARNLVEGRTLTVVQSDNIPHELLLQIVRNGKGGVVLA